MCDEDEVKLIKFVFDRFTGSSPDDRSIQNAIDDWRREAFPKKQIPKPPKDRVIVKPRLSVWEK